jgi:hypothetical protein
LSLIAQVSHPLTWLKSYISPLWQVLIKGI